ncbi:MAG: ATP-binding cassette domain-containing protein, partial [Anaerolineae bacterium]
MFHPITWLVWLTSALIAALSTRNPLYLIIIVLAATTVRVAWRGQSPTALAWGVIIRLGLMLWGVTALFDTLVAHQGVTVLFTFPSGWPLVGGPITLESLVYGLISGMALTALLMAFATFNGAVDHFRLLQLTPAFMSQAGLILSIAVVFVPQMMAALQDIRRAQRLRGHKFRGMRDLLPLIVPLLGSALERAIGLAEAMEARGAGSPSPADEGRYSAARRLAVLVSVLAATGGFFATRYWPAHSIAGWALTGVGALVFVVVWRRAGLSRKRTRYRSLRLARSDALVISTAIVTLTIIGALALSQPDALAYSPYPQIVLPDFNPLAGIALLLLATPALRLSTGAREQGGRGAGVQRRGGAGGRRSGGEIPATSLRGQPVVDLRDVSYWYPECDVPALNGVSMSIEAGEFVLVMGPSGAGKSTFLRLLNGLAPHFTGGTIRGTVRVAGRDPVARGTTGMADAVGFVFQDPEAQFVTDRVEDELVYAMENVGHPRAEMQDRLMQVLDQLDLHGLRERRVDTLSGGERQRVAIGSVLTLQPRVLVLDEPTSQLDPAGAEDVLTAITELNQQLGLTVFLAEHRLERVLPYVDKIIYFPGEGQAPEVGRPRDIVRESDLAPPVVELARAMGWEPLPLTVEEARFYVERESRAKGGRRGNAGKQGKRLRGNSRPSPAALRVLDLWCAYDGSDVAALRGVDLWVGQGEVVAIVGSNGAGKTTLLRCVMGLVDPSQGQIELLGRDARAMSTSDLAAFVGFVPQNAGAMLFTDSVQEEIAFTRRSHALPPNGRGVLETFHLLPLAEQYPWDLSVGERQRVAIAAFLAAEPELLLLDEPTRGLDYRQKATLTSVLRQHQAAGNAALLVTHDVELVAAAANRMVILEEGQVVAEGPTSEVMRDHPRFASQLSRLFQDGRLTTSQCRQVQSA